MFSRKARASLPKKKKNDFVGAEEKGTTGRADLSLISGIPYGPLNTARHNS